MTINWKKSLIVLCDIVIAAYLVLAVTSFNKPDVAATHCTEVKTDIEQNIVDGFLTADEIGKMLRREKVWPLSKPMRDISARKIEETLLKSPFVEKAEVYKTQSGEVCIQVRQRVPVVKVMADNGDCYYIDSHASVMPENRFVNDLIIATGHISRKYAQTYLSRVANCIMQDKFWQNQIVQINVLPDLTMEFVPRVGDHIIFIGAPVGVAKKLERMRKFYIYGLNKAGWNKYSYINVEFDNQIICKKVKK
ncbi:MAG: cell division protein FtsQ [Prevotella sp.]|nr:cell division protein FtsQ [Prevotella sp.]